jgi:hypothetical protein
MSDERSDSRHTPSEKTTGSAKGEGGTAPASRKDLEISGPGAADFLTAPGGADFPGSGQNEGMAQTRDESLIDSKRLTPDLDPAGEDVEKKWESPEALAPEDARGRPKRTR